MRLPFIGVVYTLTLLAAFPVAAQQAALEQSQAEVVRMLGVILQKLEGLQQG